MSLEAFAAGRRLSRARMVLYLPLRAVARSIQTMSQSGPASTTAKHRARAFLVSLCALAGALPLPCLAGRVVRVYEVAVEGQSAAAVQDADRKSTRLNSSHVEISYAVFCLKKKSPPHGWPPT